MKILAIINVSNTDDLTCDSGVIFQRILAKEFTTYGVEYGIIGPELKAFRDLDLQGVKKHYVNLGTTRYASRFSFDWNALYSIIQQEEPDLIFNNQIEITAALRSLLVTAGIPQLPIVSYCHYPALWGVKNCIPQIDDSLNHQSLGLPIVFDILGALLTANTVILQSEFAKELLVKTAHYFNIKEFQDIVVIPPPADPLLAADQPIQIPKKNRIIYNHRLYQSYGSEEFFQFIESISNLDFELIVSDPMPRRSSVRSNLSASPAYYRERVAQMKRTTLVDGNVERSRYKEIIKGAKIAFAAFRKACVWSMAAVDCMGLGIPVVAPNYAAYPEFIPQSLLFDNFLQASDVTDRLLNDDHFWKKSSQVCYEMALQLAPDLIARRFLNVFESKLATTVPT